MNNSDQHSIIRQDWVNYPRLSLSLKPPYLVLVFISILGVYYSLIYLDWAISIVLGTAVLSAVFLYRPAVGLLITLIIYIPDQIFASTSQTVRYSPGRLLPVMAIVACLPYLLKGRLFPNRTKYAFLCLVGLICWYWIMLCIEYNSDAFNYVLQLTLLCLLALPMVSVLGKPTHAPIVFLLQVAMGEIGAIFLLSGRGAVTGDLTRRLTYEGLGINAISMMLGLSIIAGLVYLHIGTKKTWKFLLIPSILIIYMAVLRTGTRSVIWGIPFSVLFTYVFVSGRKFYKYWALGALFVAIFAGGLAFAKVNNFVMGQLADRIFYFVQYPQDVRYNTRYSLWSDALEWYLDNPMGTGPGSENEMSKALAGHDLEAHNTFVSTLLQANIVGLGLLILAIAVLGVKAIQIRIPSYRIAAILSFTYVLIQLNKGSALQTRLFWFPIVLVFILVEASMQFKKVPSGSSSLDSPFNLGLGQ